MGHVCLSFYKRTGLFPIKLGLIKKKISFLSHDFGGHSACAGGATFYASLGLSAFIIQAIGRWSSSAWEIYIRDNPTVHAEHQLASIQLHLLQN